MIVILQATAAPAPQPQFNEAALAELEGMGFPLIRCQRALHETKNVDANTAMEWLFDHMEDAGVCIFSLLQR